MLRNYFISAFIALCLMPSFTACQTSPEGKNTDKEKALSVKQYPKKSKIISVKFRSLDKDSAFYSFSLEKHEYVGYMCNYKRDGRSKASFYERNDKIIELTTALKSSKLETYYKQNLSDNTEVGGKWDFSIEWEDATFEMEGENTRPEDYPVLKTVMQLFDEWVDYPTETPPLTESKIVRYSYSHKNSMRPGGPEWTLTALDDGRYKLDYKNEQYGQEDENKVIICDAKVGDDLHKIFEEGHINTYKKSYIAEGVYDGSNWSFRVDFADGTSISSSGYMDYPWDDSGIKKSCDYIQELLK